MKIIIAGMSSVGLFLVKMISANTEYDVTVIDNCKAEVDKATDLYNVSGVCGSCSSHLWVCIGLYIQQVREV